MEISNTASRHTHKTNISDSQDSRYEQSEQQSIEQLTNNVPEVETLDEILNILRNEISTVWTEWFQKYLHVNIGDREYETRMDRKIPEGEWSIANQIME